MHDLDTQKAERLAALSADELGRSEEDVKINFAVPLLELLGHARLRFEHRNKDIVLRHGLPPGTTVIVETKRAATPLDRHLDQVARYAAEERALLALLTNGDELRLYAPLWPQAPTFAHTVLWTLARADLAHPPALHELIEVLGADALASGHALRRIEQRQTRLRRLWAAADAIRAAARQQRESIAARLEALDEDKTRLTDELARVDAEEAATLGGLYGASGETPIEPPAPMPVAEATKAKRRPEQRHGRRKYPHQRNEQIATQTPDAAGKPLPWLDEELLDEATDLQRRLLAAFVKVGQRSMHLRDIAALAGTSSHRLWGATSGIIRCAKVGTREPLLEISYPRPKEQERRGVILTVTDEYWPILQRLYGKK